MVDIHTHVLPFVDDGARTMDSALVLIEEAIAQGVTDLFLTPHYMKYRNYLATPDKLREIYGQLQEEVRQRGLVIRLHLGNEIFYTIEVVDELRKGNVLPMGSSRMVLVEFAVDEDAEAIMEAVHNITALKYAPILAHVERYEKLNRVEHFRFLKRMGALIQVNAGTVLGHYGKPTQKFCLNLVKNGLVDFVASDIHVMRTNHLREARQLIARKYGEPTAEKLFNNQNILK